MADMDTEKGGGRKKKETQRHRHRHRHDVEVGRQRRSDERRVCTLVWRALHKRERENACDDRNTEGGTRRA